MSDGLREAPHVCPCPPPSALEQGRALYLADHLRAAASSIGATRTLTSLRISTKMPPRPKRTIVRTLASLFRR